MPKCHIVGNHMLRLKRVLPAFRTDPANTANIKDGAKNGLSILTSFCNGFSFTIVSDFSSVALPVVLSGSCTVINKSIPTRIPGMPDIKNAHLQPLKRRKYILDNKTQ